MLLRERAWDVMRTDPVLVREDHSLREVGMRLRGAMKDHQDRACAVVLSDEGEFRGVVTAWWLLLLMEREALSDSLKLKDVKDFEARFHNACRKSFSLRAADTVEKDVPVVKPQDPLFAVLAAMLKKRRRWAVVMEGDKVLGVVCAEDLFMQVDWEGME